MQETGKDIWVRKPGAQKMEVVYPGEGNTSLPVLTFQMLSETGKVLHGFTTRMGGVSTGIFATLNLSFTRGDKEENVRENFHRISKAIGVPEERFVFAEQTHTTNVRVVTEEDAGKGILRDRDYTDVDGLVTDVPGLALFTFHADCTPLYFVDPVHGAIGLSHSGWRGTVGRMGQATLEKMKDAFGTKPEDVLAAVGPSICGDCYEVGDDVAGEFRKAFPETYPEFIKDEKQEGKFQLDLWGANKRVLLDAGILPEHLSVTDICTCCNKDILFSHRATQGKRGNLGAFLMLKA